MSLSWTCKGCADRFPTFAKLFDHVEQAHAGHPDGPLVEMAQQDTDRRRTP